MQPVNHPNHIWQNFASCQYQKMSFFHEIKRDGITSLHGIHDKNVRHFVSQLYIFVGFFLQLNKSCFHIWLGVIIGSDGYAFFLTWKKDTTTKIWHWVRKILPVSRCMTCLQIGNVRHHNFNTYTQQRRILSSFQKVCRIHFFSWMSEHDVTFYSQILIGCPDHCKLRFCWRLFETV